LSKILFFGCGVRNRKENIMKKLNVVLLFVFLLVSCSPQVTAVPTSIPTQTFTKTPTLLPTKIATLTITPSPTPRSVSDAKNVTVIVSNNVSQEAADAYLQGVAIIQAYLCEKYGLCEYQDITLSLGFSGGGCGVYGASTIKLYIEECGITSPTKLDYMRTAAMEFSTAYVVHNQGCTTNIGKYKIPPLWFDGGGLWLSINSLMWANEYKKDPADLDHRFQRMSLEDYAYYSHVREVPPITGEGILELDTNYSDNDRQKWWTRIVLGYLMMDYIFENPNIITTEPKQGEITLPVVRLCKAFLETGNLEEAFIEIGLDRVALYEALAKRIDQECEKTNFPCYKRGINLTATTQAKPDSSICGIQTDSRVECIGIKIDDSGKEVYVFRIQPFNLPPPDQWIIVSNCEVINAGYWRVTSDTYDIVFNTSVFSKGKECKVEFRFSTDQQVVLHLVVP
jgi:hypothetical protein